MTITLVAAIARNGVIGVNGDLPWRLPEDLKRFKATTMGHVLVMGRRTFDSIGRPLPGRRSIVVTHRSDWWPPNVAPGDLAVTSSVEEALAQGQAIDDEVFVVGGGQIYAEALPTADRLLLTWVHAEPEGDTYFPAVDWAKWREVDREDHADWSLVSYERNDR